VVKVKAANGAIGYVTRTVQISEPVARHAVSGGNVERR
jgi:hypothetical protein